MLITGCDAHNGGSHARNRGGYTRNRGDYAHNMFFICVRKAEMFLDWELLEQVGDRVVEMCGP